MSELSEAFFRRWFWAKELERIRIVEELPIEKPFCDKCAMSPSLLNSYFEDLVEYLGGLRD